MSSSVTPEYGLPEDLPSPRTRNVWLHDATGACLGGFWQNGSIRQQDLYDITEVIIFLNRQYAIFRWVDGEVQGTALPRNASPLLPGRYYVLDQYRLPIPLQHTKEMPLQRILSGFSTPRTERFAQQIRERDGRDVITGTVVRGGFFAGYQAAHIFPRSYEEFWLQSKYRRWVSPPPEDDSSGIDSIRNGLLMRADLHIKWDAWAFSVNPDNGYRVTVFVEDDSGIDGRILDPVCRQPDDPRRVSDSCLRWHFRNCILYNMRGAGEPVWDYDFPPGTDSIAQILEGPNPALRLELELAGRLDSYCTAE